MSISKVGTTKRRIDVRARGRKALVPLTLVAALAQAYGSDATYYGANGAVGVFDPVLGWLAGGPGESVSLLNAPHDLKDWILTQSAYGGNGGDALGNTPGNGGEARSYLELVGSSATNLFAYAQGGYGGSTRAR